MLIAYFDESGLDDSRVFSLCGYVAPEEEWHKFEKKWSSMLENPAPHRINSRHAESIGRPLKYLRASELEGLGSKRPRLLGQRNRDYLKTAAVKCVTGSALIGISSAAIIPDYDRIVVGKAKDEIGDPYMICFQHVIVEVSKSAQMFIGEDQSEGIAYIFDRHPRWSIKAHEMYNKMIEKGMGKRYRLDHFHSIHRP